MYYTLYEFAAIVGAMCILFLLLGYLLGRGPGERRKKGFDTLDRTETQGRGYDPMLRINQRR